MRLAGITWWRGNYGSVLQAYALARVLNSFENVSYEVLDQFGSIRTLHGVLERARDKSPVQIVKKLRWNYLMPQLKQRRTALDAFVEQYIPVSHTSYSTSTMDTANDSYDGFVCGSDQIWNPNLGPFNGLYWLSFANENKLKVAYAPSIGVTRLTPAQKQYVVHNAGRFDALSCRERKGAILLQQTCNMPCTHVADPTLLLTANAWRELIRKEDSVRSTDRPYALVYLLRSTEKARRAIEQYCVNKGLRIVCFPFLDPEHAVRFDRVFGDERVLDAGPAEFINLIAEASCVFCDSYHASIFCALMHRPFFLLPKIGEAFSNRIDDLLGILHIGPRDIDIDNLASDVANLPAINWVQVDACADQLRAVSFAYLRHAVQSPSGGIP